MEGAKVYVPNASDGSWQKASVVAALGEGRYKVELEAWENDPDDKRAGEAMEVNASKMEGGMLPFQNANMPANGFPNMTTLDHLHEAALLHNLRMRFFAHGCPYTYTAEIVIAVNPYRWYPELYTEEMRKEYLVFDRAKMPPHAYATSSSAYSGLQETHTDQAILVSGESGAGKTETVKIMMGHLAMIASSENSPHIKRIVESNPLLESFGNAQTVRNDNSSRFGKFIELELNTACRLVGSRCRTYLLEKSRVVSQDAGERNYHIFYQMLAVDSEEYGLGKGRTRDTMRYTKLGSSKIDKIEGKSDAERFHLTVQALEIVDVKGETLTGLMRALAAVLLLGELEFVSNPDKSDEESAMFSKDKAADAADCAEALSLDKAALEHAMTHRTIKARNEAFVKALSAANATATRDALSKELYARIFDWLVQRICKATTSATNGEVQHFIGLLDIFGFESFAINRFEQLCINYANEKLQQKFTLDVFKTVQQEYAEEGIPWDRIEFKDNAPVLALIEAKVGIIAMLNEEGVRPKGSDEIFVSKLVSVHKDDPAFSTPRIGKEKQLQFSVRHYAGEVMYTTTGWLERNKDTIAEDVTELMGKSSNALIAEIFGEAPDGGKKDSRATVATQFKASLKQLMETIGRTHTQYVRCIKPNKIKSASAMENMMVVDQLRCAGVIEAIRISRAGFPARMPLKEFSLRFVVLARAAAGLLFKRGTMVIQSSGVHIDPKEAKAAVVVIETKSQEPQQDSVAQDKMRSKMEARRRLVDGQGADDSSPNQPPPKAGSVVDDRSKCRALMTAVASDFSERYEIGRTRVYFKSGVLEALEERRALLLQAAATELVRCVRGHQAQRRYKRMRRGALRLQARRRMQSRRAAYQATRAATVRCQSLRRAVLAKRIVGNLRVQRCAIRLQAAWRRHSSLRRFLRVRWVVCKVQAVARCRACRRQYLVQLAEAKEQSKLENQVKALQARLEAQEREHREALQRGGSTSSGAGATPEVQTQVVERQVADAEMIKALMDLGQENKRLNMELDRLRTENRDLRKENEELKAGQASRGALLDFWKSKKSASAMAAESSPPSRGRATSRHDPSPSPSQGRRSLKDSTVLRPRADNGKNAAESNPGNVPAAASGGASNAKQALILYPPLSEFWEDVPCSGLPVLKSPSEVHIKFGAKVLMVEENGKHLVWSTWMTQATGYLRRMAFFVERRAERRATSRSSLLGGLSTTAAAEDHMLGPGDDGCLGLNFSLCSAFTNKYVVVGGLLDRYCLQVTGEKPEDAAVFTIMPIPGAEAAGIVSDSAAMHAFALRLVGESKCVCLRKDGYVGTASVSDEDTEIENETMSASIEYLVPLCSYEITVLEKTLGLTVGKELPIRVVGFSEPAKGGGIPKPGPAESTGRVRLGDEIRYVNGQDTSGVPRRDVLNMIACKRPVTIGFTTSHV